MDTKTISKLLGRLVYCTFFLALGKVWGQTPFLRTGQVFSILQNTNELQEFLVQPSYNSINPVPIGSLPGAGLDALGFRRTDNLLYGIGWANNHLYKIGQNATAQDLGAVGLDNSLYYVAGDISPDGRYLYAVGEASAGNTVHLAKIDLETAGFPVQFVNLNNLGRISDIAFDPGNGKLYGYDISNLRAFTLNPDTGNSIFLQASKPGNSLYGLYFDAFGDLYGVGSTLYGVVDGYFRFDKTTGIETRLTTGPSTGIADIASCPFSVELKSDVDPGINLPCTEITYTYTLANGSEVTHAGLEFLHALPAGFHLTQVLTNTFGALIDTVSIPGSLLMENISLSPGIRQLRLKLSVGDIPKKRYNSQARINKLPVNYGSFSLSDFAKEPGFEDSTAFVVNRFDEDSLDFRYLICHGETLVLESAEYGNNVQWNTGVTASSIPVTQGGQYNFVAGSSCEQIVVSNDVTSASCPFTISVGHVFVPDTTFACSDIIFHFLINNDSGEPRTNLSFADTMPAGFRFVEIVKNPFGGNLKPNSPPNIFCLQGMTLKKGADTLDVRVYVGDVPPGAYKNRAVLFGLPQVMGPLRLSDYPKTINADSSSLLVQGALSDSLHFEQIICAATEIVLDASALGKTFLWDDGSSEPALRIDAPGNYHLTIFDGCEPAEVYWQVLEGVPIEIPAFGPFSIHQGDEISLNPLILNQGSTLQIQWHDPLVNSLSCLDCASTLALPLESVVYGFSVANEQCSDSIGITVEVDKRRRIYAPNIFSPNDDGYNDHFFLQSPDYGFIRYLRIYDRWGSLVFETREQDLTTDMPQWDGRSREKKVPPGVYIWQAEIVFVDGSRQVFSGNVTVVL
jgi:gliding motility-associated-like protein